MLGLFCGFIVFCGFVVEAVIEVWGIRVILVYIFIVWTVVI